MDKDEIDSEFFSIVWESVPLKQRQSAAIKAMVQTYAFCYQHPETWNQYAGTWPEFIQYVTQQLPEDSEWVAPFLLELGEAVERMYR